MVFVTAGTGGGTGTGAAPIIAQVARELGALTVGVVTKPFSFEGKRRKIHSEQGIQSLKACVDTLITIPNQRLLSIAPPQMSMLDGFKLADEVLLNAVKGISDIINIPGRVNVDFADVRTIMSEMGMALMGIGTATGQSRAIEAARAAINSPLLEDVDIEGATGILINITGSSAMTLHEISEASTLIQEAVHEDANIIFGSVVDESMGDTLRVTVIATGFDHARVSLPDAHNKMYSNSTNGYGYQTTNGMQAGNSANYGMNGNTHNQRPGNNGFGYGNTQNDPRMNHGGGLNQGMRSDMGSNRGGGLNQGMQTGNNPIAAGLSLRAPYEVGQPVNNMRRTENQGAQHDVAQGMQQRAFQGNTSGVVSQNTTSFGSGNNFTGHSQNNAYSNNSHGLNGAGTSANQQRTSVQSESETGNSEALLRQNLNSGKNEFEELTQWTLELSRQANNAGQQADVGPAADLKQDHFNGLSAMNLVTAGDESENENEKALRLARELADITPDEGDFETPAFLRRKEDTRTRPLS